MTSVMQSTNTGTVQVGDNISGREVLVILEHLFLQICLIGFATLRGKYLGQNQENFQNSFYSFK